MSLAAVPAYLLARRVLAPPLSLARGAARASRCRRSSTRARVMTENAFYPLFLTAALLLVLVLERPTPLRRSALLALVGLVVRDARAGGRASSPALLLAPLLLAAARRRPLRPALRRFRPLYGVVRRRRGCSCSPRRPRAAARSTRPARRLLGRRRRSRTTPEAVARFFLYHLAELDLYLGVLPFAAFLLLLVRSRRRLEPPLAPFLAAAIALTVSVLLVVAAFASRVRDRIQERNTFVVAPLFLIALLVWVERGAAAAARAARRRGRRRARCCRSRSRSGPLHRDRRDLGHARAAADLGGVRLAAVRLDRRDRARGRRARGGALPARAAPLRARRCRLARCSSSRRLVQRLVRRARLPARPRSARSSRGSAPASATGSTRGAGRRDASAFVWTGVDRPLRRQPERVLQPQRRAGLLRRRADAGRAAPRRRSRSTRDRRLRAAGRRVAARARATC